MNHQRSILESRGTRYLPLGLLLILPANGQMLPGKPGGIQGVAFTTESSQERTFVPGAHVQIQCTEAGSPAIDVNTDEAGRFLAPELVPCRYRITAGAGGLEAAPLEAVVQPGQITPVEIELKPASVKEEVTVSAQADAIDTTEAQSKAVLQQSTLEHAPNVNDRVEGLLPLLPGVVRGPDGLINMKGARTSQSGMLLNSANVTDPVTGLSGINLPIDVVSTAEVVANPYDPEYGKAAGAVETIGTRVSDFERFRLRLNNFFPRPRVRDGTIMGVESVTPRLTLTGPIIRNRVAITQSFEYRNVRSPVTSLPQLHRDTRVESLDSYTQVDLSLSEQQSASIDLAFYPQKLTYLGLNTFLPQPATPDLHQRGHFLAFAHKLVTHSGSLLASQVSYKTLDADLKPNSTEPFILGIETTTGGFFNQQHRETNRFEWQEVFNVHEISAWGQHQVKIGGDFVRNAYDGKQTFNPVQVLGEAGELVQSIDYSPGVKTSVRQREYTGFLLDKWKISSKVTLDAGLRSDRDSVSGEDHVAPRLGLAVAPFAGGRTVIRAGAGYFYDRVNLNVPTFTVLPEQTLTTYLSDGSVLGTLTYHHLLTGPLHNPRSTAWNAEIQQQVRPNLIVQAAYNQRYTAHNLYLEPRQEGSTGALLLSNLGRDYYREFLVSARYQIHRHVLNASYVRSSAVGDLNDFNQFFGNLPNPIIRTNQRSLLNFDAPNRFVFWGQFEAPGKITFSPVWDIHTGFPYSIVDQERDFIGARNRAGRFPTFSSTDMEATRLFALPFLRGKYKARIGVRVFNIFGHYNPRDFQGDTASYRYDAFLNSVGRTLRGKFTLEF